MLDTLCYVFNTYTYINQFSKDHIKNPDMTLFIL